MFKITEGLVNLDNQTPVGKGFQLTFANNWTISVQFGWGNYCDNYNDAVFTPIKSSDAEIAVWRDSRWVNWGGRRSARPLQP